MSVDPRFAHGAALAEIDRVFPRQQARRPEIAATSAPERIDRIRRLHDALLSRRSEIQNALFNDYG